MLNRIFGRVLEGRDHLEDLGTNGRIILICILGKWTWRS
jgi:hypothetical protein